MKIDDPVLKEKYDKGYQKGLVAAIDGDYAPANVLIEIDTEEIRIADEHIARNIPNVDRWMKHKYYMLGFVDGIKAHAHLPKRTLTEEELEIKRS